MPTGISQLVKFESGERNTHRTQEHQEHMNNAQTTHPAKNPRVKKKILDKREPAVGAWFGLVCPVGWVAQLVDHSPRMRGVRVSGPCFPKFFFFFFTRGFFAG